MKSALIAVLFCVCVRVGFAGDFQSKPIAATTSLPAITVPANHFLRIRNFTQDGGTTRGFVSVTPTGGTATNVLSASKIVTTDTAPETINSIVIAGPAMVTVSALSANAFITYIKQSDSD
jgi:hypothetical protein